MEDCREDRTGQVIGGLMNSIIQLTSSLMSLKMLFLVECLWEMRRTGVEWEVSALHSLKLIELAS
jgi:hypothetical protein